MVNVNIFGAKLDRPTVKKFSFYINGRCFNLEVQ